MVNGIELIFNEGTEMGDISSTIGLYLNGRAGTGHGPRSLCWTLGFSLVAERTL